LKFKLKKHNFTELIHNNNEEEKEQWSFQQLKTFYSNTRREESNDNRQFLLPWEREREYMKHERNLSAKKKKEGKKKRRSINDNTLKCWNDCSRKHTGRESESHNTMRDTC